MDADPGELALDYGIIQERRRSSRIGIDEAFAMAAGRDASFVPLEPPQDIVLTKFSDQQKRALGWVVNREDPGHLPHFWYEIDGLYVSYLTGHQTTIKPKPLRGGILGEGFGPQKILIVVSLVVADRPSYTRENGHVALPLGTLAVCPSKIASRLLASNFKGNLILILFFKLLFMTLSYLYCI